MAYINWLIEAAKKIEENESCFTNKPSNEEIEEVASHLTKLVKSYQSRAKNGKFLSKKYDTTQSKYVGIYKNEGKWVAYIDKEKYRFKTKKEAEKYFENQCKKLHINLHTKLRYGYK